MRGEIKSMEYESSDSDVEEDEAEVETPASAKQNRLVCSDTRMLYIHAVYNLVQIQY